MDMQPAETPNDIERLYVATVHKVETGEITKGKVVAIKDDGIIVDVGYKSEGIVSASEFGSEEIAHLKKGDEIDVVVERINEQEGIISISRQKALRIRAWERINDAYNKNSTIEGTITGKTKGGFFVDISGITAFLPASQSDIRPIQDADQFIGQTVPLKILKLSHKSFHHITANNHTQRASIVVSRRAVIEEQRKIKRQEILKVLKEGAILKGKVKNITDYGVFVDLGGIDGLLHISDISWRRVNHPSEFFSIGEDKEFIVLKYDEGADKVTLGYKQKKPDPWLYVEEKYKSGMRIKGKVVSVADYGAFIEIEEGLEGLIHVSEMDWASRPKHPSKYMSVGDEIEALVVNVNKNERKLSLSLKQLQPKPWDLIAQNYKVGQIITGKVKTIADFGVFVRLPEGVDGLIHISDLSWTKHIKHPSEMLKKGQKVDAKVLSLEPDKEKMSLGIKQLLPDPWIKEIPSKFQLGKEFNARVLKLTDFGIFVELEDEVEGLVFSSEIDPAREFKEGDEVRVKVIKVNTEERKIGLSMKNIKTDKVEGPQHN